MKIKYQDNSLQITFKHHQTSTQQEYQDLLKLYQSKFSREVGKEIPLEEIEVSPKPNEQTTATTSFCVTLGNPLYRGLERIAKEDPKAIASLKEKLQHYKPKSKQEQVLLNYTIQGLEEILQ